MRSSPLNDQSEIQAPSKQAWWQRRLPVTRAEQLIEPVPPYLGRSDLLGTRTEQPLSSKSLRSYTPIAAGLAKGSSSLYLKTALKPHPKA